MAAPPVPQQTELLPLLSSGPVTDQCGDSVAGLLSNPNPFTLPHTSLVPSKSSRLVPRNQAQAAMRLRSQDGAPVEYTLKPRSHSVRLSTTQITVTPDETQHDVSERIATIANLPLSRLRVNLETSNQVLDKRVHADAAPKMGDLLDDETVLVVKDLGISIRP